MAKKKPSTADVDRIIFEKLYLAAFIKAVEGKNLKMHRAVRQRLSASATIDDLLKVMAEDEDVLAAIKAAVAVEVLQK